jgi:tetratricopeptide (TPR) repeat protein
LVRARGSKVSEVETLRFEDAFALHGQGRMGEAQHAYEAVLDAEPEHVGARLHLGAVFLAQNRISEAEATFRRALASAPDSPLAHANLAAALQASGRHAEAVSAYRRALELAPELVDACFGLAACLQALGRSDEALAAYEAALARAPGHPEANYGLASLLVTLKRSDEAEARYRAALAADPDFAEASYGLGALLAGRGAFQPAIDCFRQALDVDPQFAGALVGLGQCLLAFDRDAEAHAAFTAALAAEPDHVEARYGLARTLSRNPRQRQEAISHFRAVLAVAADHADAMLGLASGLAATGWHEESLALCRRAAALRPDSAAAASQLALRLAEIGDLEPAAALGSRAVELAPERLENAFNYASIAKIRPGDPALNALESALRRENSLSDREKCWLHFALAKAYDDLGERARGFDHLMRGNRAKRAAIVYDEAAMLGGLERIQRVFTAELMASRVGTGDPWEAPVFILGMPRSGTSLVEQMLASHPSVFGAGERMELPQLLDQLAAAGHLFPECVGTMLGKRLRRLGADYATALRALAPSAARITDKLPGNFQLIGLILLILPNARIIHLVRDPVDTCLSCYSRLFTDDNLIYSYDLSELGRFYAAYSRMMAHWRSILSSGSILDVSYEAMVKDFPSHAREIVAYCGLPWNDACLRFHENPRPVVTASAIQVRRTVYQSSVGRWRPDASLLKPLLDALEGG